MSRLATRMPLSRRRFLSTAALASGACAVAACNPRAAAASPTPAVKARFYETLDDRTVRCTLCPRGCRVPPGGRGYCRVRENRDGVFYALTYGRPCARHTDPIEKKPLFHVFPGAKAFSLATVGCNIACTFCQNWDISQAAPEDVAAPYRSPADIAGEAVAAGARVVAYTYNEPTVFFEYMTDCARAARERNLGNVVISNGFIAEKPLAELTGLMTAIKIDLKAFTQSFYETVCGGQLEPVRLTLKRIVAAGVWLEVVVLLIPTLNDGDDEIRRMADWIAGELGPDVPVHFSRFHPTYKLRSLPPTPPATVVRARELARAAGCRFVYTGNLPGDAGENTFCPACGKVVIQRHGYLVREVRLTAGTCACGAVIPGVWS